MLRKTAFHVLSASLFMGLLGLVLESPSLGVAGAVCGVDDSVTISHASLSSIEWDHYHNYTEIVDTIRQLNTSHPDIVDVFSIGESWQNRTIYCVRLTNESQAQPKPEVFFVGGHHAREPISVELPLYFLVQAATEYGKNETYTYMLDHCEIYVVAALNPDGLQLFEKNDLQRKNVCPIDEDQDGLQDEDPPEDEDADGFIERLIRKASGTFIRWEGNDNDDDGRSGEDHVGGVDLNRNYGFAWNFSTESGSTDPRDEDYKGSAPFSEPETQALRELALQHDFRYALSFHSGAEVILYPWGYTETPTLDDEKFQEIASNLSDLIGCRYEQSSQMYTTSGDWDDWMYGNRSTFAFTCEIFVNNSEWFSEPGPTAETKWRGGYRYAFNPRPSKIEYVLQKWLPVFPYTVKCAISEAEKIDVAVIDVIPYKTVACRGYTTTIDAIVHNRGANTETFNVTACANQTHIQRMIVTLPQRHSVTITFYWNTTAFDKGNYTISVYASPILGEIYTLDNSLTDGWTIVSMIGDLTGLNGYPDGKCNMRDIGIAARHFGKTVPPAPANCDITGSTTGIPDGLIDIRDIVIPARHFGEADN